MEEKNYYERFFLHKNVLPITKDIIDLAIQYRQSKSISVGDSIQAATAVLHNLELQTRNVSDFVHIPGLKIHNPI